jgi:hypothetical protein
MTTAVVRPTSSHGFHGTLSRLLSPSEIADDDWSIYDSQLTVYLATSPRINDAIQQFGRAYDLVASGQ